MIDRNLTILLNKTDKVPAIYRGYVKSLIELAYNRGQRTTVIKVIKALEGPSRKKAQNGK